MLRLFIIRLKSQKSPFIADRLHIHHLLLERFGLLKTNILVFLNLLLPLLIYYFYNVQFYALLTSVLIYFLLLFISTFNKSWKKNNN
jgi:VIT1/CCC1 family predicted Fe2+/Mn2+ transporter